MNSEEAREIALKMLGKEEKQVEIPKKELSQEEIEKNNQNLRLAYDKIIELFDFYVDMPKNYIKIIAIWIIGTYFHNSFETYPFLFLNARKGSGKTRTERLISYLSKGTNGEVNTGITESALYRSEKGATLVLDEFESITSKDKKALREYLQASYKKGGIVTRSVKVKKDNKETYEPEKFVPYRPIVMANINGMDDVLGDRCLTLILDKSQNPLFTKKMENFENNPQINEILLLLKTISDGSDMMDDKKTIINGWNHHINAKYSIIHPSLTIIPSHPSHPSHPSLNYHKSLFEKLDEMDINGRNLELVFPLLILINNLYLEKLDEFIVIFKEIISQKITEDATESKDELLISYVAQTNNWTDYVESKLLLQGFKEFIGWSQEDQWLTPEWLGRALLRNKLYSSKRNMTKGKEYLLNVQKAKMSLNKNTQKKGEKEDEI